MPIRRRGALAHRHPDRRAPAAGRVPGSFERRVEAALDSLPPEIARLLENGRHRDRGPADPGAVSRRGSRSARAGCTASTRGPRSIEWGADQVPFPNVITLFRIPLQEDFPDPAEQAWEIARTVVHELAHHAGIDDERLHELGYD